MYFCPPPLTLKKFIKLRKMKKNKIKKYLKKRWKCFK
jgi:hypothetical protein